MEIQGDGMRDGFEWHNKPADVGSDTDGLWLTTDDHTDFWQQTFYGFERDNGHAYLTSISGDFTASVTVRGDYQCLYDQAGLMLRIDHAHWVKTGIEFTDGLMHFSVVVTNGRSDWSVVPLYGSSVEDEVHVRLTRHGSAVRVQYALNDASWQLARLAPFDAKDARVGIMACSPERAGFRASFRDLSIGPSIAKDLHG